MRACVSTPLDSCGEVGNKLPSTFIGCGCSSPLTHSEHTAARTYARQHARMHTHTIVRMHAHAHCHALTGLHALLHWLYRRHKACSSWQLQQTRR